MNNHNKIAIILPSIFPVPATKGGAIETLIEVLVEENEKNINGHVEFIIYSAFEKEAFIKSKTYTKTTFYWIKYDSFFYNLTNFFIRSVRKLFKIKIYNMEVLLIASNIKKQDIKNIVIESNTYFLEGIAFYLKKNAPIFHVHADLFDKLNSKNVFLASLCKRIITVSDYIQKEVLLNTQINCQKVCILMNGIFPPSYMGIYDRRYFQLHDTDIIITFVGRITKSKGITELINAFKIINKENVILLIAGSFGSKFNFGDDDANFRKEVETLCVGIKDKVVFTGYISNKDIGDIYNLSDIVVVPSQCEDAAPLGVIEALHCGKPLIVSATGGIPEYVSEKCSFLINKGEYFVQDFSNTLIKLIEDKELRDEMSYEAKNISRNFTSKSFYNNFVNAVLDI